MVKEFPMNSSQFHPFGNLIGLEFDKVEGGKSHCRIEIKPDLLNPHGVVHGGVIYSMVDTGMGGALYTELDPDELCATVEIKINYFRATASGTLDCETTLVHRGKRIAVLESEVTQQDQLIAKALGTYSIFPQKTTPK